ncbi:MAG: hypothetical protein MOGMAGMI_01458 [Candidatus Omnitrophica bacterium]|nr:hypothetical protein [Candidatus Omnitrophota bacterium]
MKVDVDIRLEVRADHAPEPVESAVRARITESFASLARGETVLRSVLLSAALGVEGVVRAELVSPRADVGVAASTTALLGGLHIHR